MLQVPGVLPARRKCPASHWAKIAFLIKVDLGTLIVFTVRKSIQAPQSIFLAHSFFFELSKIHCFEDTRTNGWRPDCLAAPLHAMLSVERTTNSRLRRAKSTSSAQTNVSSTGHARSWTAIDPFVTRQYAESAAVEAFQRAQAANDHRAITNCSAVGRRRSQRKGTSEGSHLEDARLGRRRSTKVLVKDRPVRPMVWSDWSREDTQARNMHAKVGDSEPCPTKLIHESSTLPALGNRASVYAKGGPETRECRGSAMRNMNEQHLDPSPEQSDLLDDTTLFDVPSKRASIREMQTDEDIMALARDRCLQDLQMRKVRERRSFILAPFQKRRMMTATDVYDPVVSPPMPGTIEHANGFDQSQSYTSNPHRVSDSLKGRLKRAFRLTSKALPVPVIPPQHVEARDYRWMLKNYDIPDELPENQNIGTMSSPDSGRVVTDQTCGASFSQVSTSRSRITSWTNTTVTGVSTLRSRQNAHGMDGASRVVEIHDLRTENDATQEPRVRKMSSFFGRPVRNRLQSKGDLKTSSEQSKGLFDALQRRIRPMQSEQCMRQRSRSPPKIPVHALSTWNRSMLPSQKASAASHANFRHHSPSPLGVSQNETSSLASLRGSRSVTIRTVTPDPPHGSVMCPSPILEVSPASQCDGFGRLTLAEALTAHRSVTPDVTGVTDQSPATPAARPTQAQLNQRMLKAENRWMSPLDELSPPPPRIIAGGTGPEEENPYEMRVASRYLNRTRPPRDPSSYTERPTGNATLPVRRRRPFGAASASDEPNDGVPRWRRVADGSLASNRASSPEVRNSIEANSAMLVVPPQNLTPSPGHGGIGLSRSPRTGSLPRTPTPHIATHLTSCSPDTLRPGNHHAEGVLLSPSIYSRATDGASPRTVATSVARHNEDASPDGVTGGTVITITGREVKRYEFAAGKSRDNLGGDVVDERPADCQQKDRKRRISMKPSAEWRRWLSSEFGLFGWATGGNSGGNGSRRTSQMDGHPDQPSATHNTVVDMHPDFPLRPDDEAVAPNQDATVGTVRRWNANEASVNRLAVDSRPPSARPPSRPRTSSRTSSGAHSSYMNERYPMVSPPAGIAASTERLPRKVASFSHPPQVAETDGSGSWETVRDDDLGDGAMGKRTAVELPGERTEDAPNRCSQADTRRLTVATTRPKSAYELHVKYKHEADKPARPLEVRRRRIVAGASDRREWQPSSEQQSQPNKHDRLDSSDHGPLRLEEDPTLLDISAGPYANTRTAPHHTNDGEAVKRHLGLEDTGSLHQRNQSYNRRLNSWQENARPTHTPTPVPAALESLSSAEWFLGGCRSATTESPQFVSASTNATFAGAGRRRSPGQRMATDWLDGRRNTNSSRADISGSSRQRQDNRDNPGPAFL